MPNLLADRIFDSLWKEYAPAYSRILPMISFYAETVDLMVNAVDGSRRVLDLGCGPGIIAGRLAKKDHKVIATDNDKTMIEYTGQRLANYPNVNVIQQDVHSLVFGNETFDGIVCNNVIYYVHDPLKVLQESYRVLKSSGKLAVTGPRPNPDLDLLFQTMIRDLEAKGVLDKFSKEIEVIKACNRFLAEKSMRNVYSNADLEQVLLADVGFSEILVSRGCYLSQSYFILAQK